MNRIVRFSVILLSLQPHFTILREKVFFGKKDPKNSQKSDAQQYLEAEAKKEGAVVSCLHPEDEWVYAKPLQALHINLLREYLTGEFKCLQHGLPFPFDFERVIDDFVFMCFFVGKLESMSVAIGFMSSRLYYNQDISLLIYLRYLSSMIV